MAVGTVEFYRLPGSMSSNEYPILSANQDISAYLVHSIANCKYTHDLLQAIGPVKTFTGYDNVNIAKIDGEFYWIVNRMTKTLQYSDTVTYGLSYNAPTSNLRIGQSLTGAFVKTPTQIRAYMSNAVSNDTMAHSRHVDLPHNPTITAINNGTTVYEDRRIYWVEIVTIRQNKIGFFVWDPRFTSNLSGIYKSVRAGYSEYYYPPYDYFTDPANILGIVADKISAIHISERCPYQVTKTTYTRDSLTFDAINLTSHNASRLGDTGYYVYFLSDTGDDVPTEITIELNEMERACGSVRLINESGNAIASIPTQYGSNMTIATKTVSDLSGIFTEVSYNGRIMTTFTEGFVPFYGSAWETYKAYSMSIDREQVTINKQINNAELDVQINQSRGNAMLGIGMSLGAMDITNPVGLVGGAINIAGQIANEALTENAMNTRNQIENKALDMNQQLLEKRMASAPGTAYDTGYGFIYIYNCEHHPANLRLEMPANLTQSYYDAHVAEFGYPSEGVITLTLSAGFIQGKVLNDGTLVGEKFDELNRTIQNGLKMKAIQ